MNYLKLISAYEHRKKVVLNNVGQYWLDRLVEKVQRSMQDEILATGTVLAILRDVNLERELIIPGLNIVTDEGDLFYAQRAAEEQPDDDHFTTGAASLFDGIMELYNGASAAPAKGNDRSDMAGLVTDSDQVIDGTYPRTADPDGDNTGAAADSLTFRVSYATGDANATGIADVILTNPTPAAAENLLMQAEFGTPFEKTSADTLKVFVNHNFLGV